jgi:hypothetical protein
MLDGDAGNDALAAARAASTNCSTTSASTWRPGWRSCAACRGFARGTAETSILFQRGLGDKYRRSARRSPSCSIARDAESDLAPGLERLVSTRRPTRRSSPSCAPPISAAI